MQGSHPKGGGQGPPGAVRPYTGPRAGGRDQAGRWKIKGGNLKNI